MADSDAVIACAGMLALTVVTAAVHLLGGTGKMKKRSRRHVWVKPWIRTRNLNGAYHTLFNDLLNFDEASFRNFIRMDLPAFEDVLSMVENEISKCDTKLRRSISARERLCLTIRYMATGKKSVRTVRYFCLLEFRNLL
jgi:hypothetical protein